MTSQPACQTITIHILPNISQRQGKQTMKFGQLIEYKRYIVPQNSHRKCSRLVPDLFVSQKSFTWSKRKWTVA